MTDTGRSYDRVSQRYAAELGDELHHKPLDRALLEVFAELATGGLVADVGCGPGHVTAHLATLGVRAVGLDLSPRMCAQGRRATGLPFAAADMTALPLAPASLSGIISLYAVIHVSESERRTAYRQFVRVLKPGGHALIAFHTSDADTAMGGSRATTELLGEPVDLTFHFLDPDAESRSLAEAGFTPVARLDREPHQGTEHPSRRSYLLVRRG